MQALQDGLRFPSAVSIIRGIVCNLATLKGNIIDIGILRITLMANPRQVMSFFTFIIQIKPGFIPPVETKMDGPDAVDISVAG